VRREFTKAKDRTMRVFVTGATGFIGSAVVPELIGAGQHVVGAEVFRGDVNDLDCLRTAAPT
jgi:uncharacterized protein YbjT (DUF2867 family)